MNREQTTRRRSTAAQEAKRGGTTVLERPRTQAAAGTATTTRTRTTRTQNAPWVPGHHTEPRRAEAPARSRSYGRRLGSQQVVSVRGRRVEVEHADPKKIRFVVFMVAIMVAAVAGTLALSTTTTTQSFELQELQRQDRDLDNRIETLSRDLENSSSAAEIARHAGQLGMVVPDQPGVVERMPDGSVAETRPADPSKTRPIVDVNGRSITPTVASSNPAATDAVAGNVAPLPNLGTPGEQPASPAAAPNQVPGTAPYAARR